MSKKDGTLDDKLLKALACPICKAGIDKISEEKLKCQQCGKEYEIDKGVPKMLVSEEEVKNYGSTS